MKQILNDLPILRLLNNHVLTLRTWDSAVQGKIHVKKEEEMIYFHVEVEEGSVNMKLKDVKYVIGNLNHLPSAYMKSRSGGVIGFILSKITKQKTLTFMLYGGELIVGKILSEYPYSFLVEASPNRNYLVMKHSIKIISSYGAGATELLRIRKRAINSWVPRKEWVNKKKTKTLLRARKNGKSVILSLREGESIKGIIKDVTPHAILFSAVYRETPMKLLIYRHSITGVKYVKKRKKQRK